jgi:hypothetical protein
MLKTIGIDFRMFLECSLPLFMIALGQQDKKTTSEKIILRKSFSLHQHSNWIFQELRQFLHELRGFGSIADNGGGGFHAIATSMGGRSYSLNGV